MGAGWLLGECKMGWPQATAAVVVLGACLNKAGIIPSSFRELPGLL